MTLFRNLQISSFMFCSELADDETPDVDEDEDDDDEDEDDDDEDVALLLPVLFMLFELPFEMEELFTVDKFA